jgi:hypothetical protein
MKYVYYAGIGAGLLVSVALNGCSSTPSKGSPEYIKEQVYQCRSLCANAEVNIAQIEGLNCVCNKPQQPFIYNPIVTGSNGKSQAPMTVMPQPQAQVQPIIINGGNASSPKERVLTPHENAIEVTDSTGRQIFSQVSDNVADQVTDKASKPVKESVAKAVEKADLPDTSKLVKQERFSSIEKE